MRTIFIMAVMGKIENHKGFTLVELVVVMSIIVVLAILVIGAITMVRRGSRKSQLYNDAKIVQSALQKYASDHNGLYPPIAQPYNGSWDAYIMTNTDATDNTVTAQVNQIQNGQVINMKGILAPYLGKEMKRPFSASSGRLCYYGVNTASSTNGFQYLLWVQTEDELDKHTSPDWRANGCPSTHATVASEDPGSIFSLK